MLIFNFSGSFSDFFHGLIHKPVNTPIYCQVRKSNAQNGDFWAMT
jgi:hypothetical protein